MYQQIFVTWKQMTISNILNFEKLAVRHQDALSNFPFFLQVLFLFRIAII